MTTSERVQGPHSHRWKRLDNGGWDERWCPDCDAHEIDGQALPPMSFEELRQRSITILKDEPMTVQNQTAHVNPSVVAIDTETFLIGPGELAPKMVCATFAWRNGSQIETLLLGNGPADEVEQRLRDLLLEGGPLLVFHNAAYDLTVIARSYPDLIPLIFDALQAGRITDTIVREKLLNLSTHGKLEMLTLPDGSSTPLKYNLAVLAAQYLGKDRSEEKDSDNCWRLNYCMLDGLCASEYPDEAAAYAQEDAADTLGVYEAQIQRANIGGSLETEFFQTAADFALRLITVHGFAINQTEVERIAAVVEEARKEDKIPLLIESGVVRPGEPARPYARGVKNPDGTPKMKAAVAPSRNMAKLKEIVEVVCKEHGIPPKKTDGGETSTDADMLDQLAGLHPVLDEYAKYMEFGKIVSDLLPALRGAEVVYPNFNVVVETGRTSSYGSSKRDKSKPPLYPSVNIQNQGKDLGGIDPRRCYIPRPGTVLWDVDYQALELACVGQITKDLLGDSVHLRRYNEGFDLHAYLGAQLAFRFGEGKVATAFQQAVREARIESDPVALYHSFLKLKKSEDEAVAKFFKHYRSFAKPVGLGFPGGLGPAKMVTFARTTYNVHMTEEQAHAFREVWHDTYPEMRPYFAWVSSQSDETNKVLGHDDEGNAIAGLWYTTPLGMVRRGATYCAVANGKAMQSPGAEGAKAATILVQRACWDPTQESVLFGCRPTAMVHDQIIGETTDNPELWSVQCLEVSRLMIEAMSHVLPDVQMRTEPLLTTVWTKDAVPTFDEAGNLIPWEPK